MTTVKLTRARCALGVTAATALAAQAAGAATPANDAISAAVAIRPLPFHAALSMAEATSASDDPADAGQGASVWYAFTASSDTRLLIDTIGSDFDTTLAVYTGAPGALRLVSWDDDGGSEEGQSRLLLSAARGATYYLLVGAFAGVAPGALSLSAKVAPPPPTVRLRADQDGGVDAGTGVATIHGSVTCSSPSVVGILGNLSQHGGSGDAAGSVFTYVLCSGQTLWSAEVTPSGAHFAAGPVRLAATASGYSQETGEYADANAAVDMRLTAR